MSLTFEQLPPSLPGYEIIAPGYEDLKQNRETVGALLLSMSRPNLERMGIFLPAVIQEPDVKLYRFLQKEHDDNAHSRYNSLIRLLISFEKTIPCVI